MTPLELAKERLTIPALAGLRGWEWKPGKSCRLPYQQDRSASGSVLAGDKLFHDFTSGETMDAPALLARVESMTNEAACKLFIQLAGVTSADVQSGLPPANKRAFIEPPEPTRTKPRLPHLVSPTRDELKHVAELRNVSLDAVTLASKRGFLFVTRLNGVPCWALTDASRWLCQLRRMDGQLFVRQDAPGFKAWTVADSRGAWPIGCEESQRFPSIALVEGGGDFLAACHFIALEGRGSDVAPVALLGASNRIASESLPLFRSKAVRIFAHVDKPNPKGACPGLEAAARWQEQLSEAGAVVTCFDFSGLRKTDESPVRDLNDLTSIHPDDFESESELSELMNFGNMSEKKKKSRVVRAVKSDPAKPAVFEPVNDEPKAAQTDPKTNGIFDAAEVVKRENVWWLNASKRYFRPASNGKEWISVGEQDIKRKLRLAGVFSRAAEGQSCSQADRVMDYIQDCRYVDFAGRLAGYKAGVHYVQDRPIVVLGSYTLIEPVEGDWPVLRALLEGMLKTPDFDQLPYFFAWLKVAITALRDNERRGGHALIFVGAHNCGKSFVQEHVITKLLGNRSADPTAYMLNKTTFNAELLGSEHLMISELPSGLDRESRAFLGEQLKKIVATEGHSYHPKGLDAVTMYPFWRVTISVNKNPERIKALPPINSDIADKIMLFLVESKPMPMPARSDEERRAFRMKIYSELPAFVYFLLNWTIPAELLGNEHADRFGCSAFQHPQIIADLFEQEPESELLYMIDNELFDNSKNTDAWGWLSSKTLEERLTGEACRFASGARKLFRFPGACGSYLAKLREKDPQRFQSKHTKPGNVWLILPPA